MTGQTLLQPSRQIEAMIRGLTDAAQSLGSHLLYSHCCSSHRGRASTTAIRTAYTQFAVETGKWTAKRNVSQCCRTQLFQIHKAVCEIRNLRSKVRWSLICPTPFCLFPPCRKWICTESFEKLPPAQQTYSLFQYMVMRNSQLTGLCQEEAQNKGGVGVERRTTVQSCKLH